MDNPVNAPNPASMGSMSGVNTVLETAVRSGVGVSVAIVLQELKRACDNPAIIPYVDKGLMDYVAAVGALAYTGREVYADGIIKLIEAVDIVPNDEILSAVKLLHFKNHLVYINAVFFLIFLGREPNKDDVIEIVKSMDISPDAVIAEYVITYSKDYMSTKGKGVAQAENLQGKTLDEFKRLSVTALDMSNTIAELMIREIQTSLQNENIQSHVGPKIVPYIGAVASLAFSGRDTDPGNISKLLNVVEIPIDEELLNATATLHFKNHIFYIIALYFLLTVGMEPSTEYIIRVVKALGASPDATIANYMMAYYTSKKNAVKK